jgi:protein-S-isoprenylcysteine O-methyltransferase Ste14
MHGERETSNKTRIALLIGHAILLGIAVWILFGGGISLIGNWFGIVLLPGDSLRRTLLLIFGIILFIRITITGFYLLKRKIGWSEMGGILAALLLYQIGYAICGAAEGASIGLYDYIAIFVFVLGSLINTVSELQRKHFKDQPENKGKLYTRGLFRLSRHINYFGDTLWTIGWAILTLNWWAAIMPILCTLNFVVFMIPLLTNYLEERYQEQFQAWREKTKKFIPFIY